ncbi:MAG: hypothetical protein ACSHW0_18015 [Thalassotalea sp.]
MNQALLLNNDLTFDQTNAWWTITGFYQSQDIVVYIKEAKLARTTVITAAVIFDIEADIEDWLEVNEPDENNNIWL